MLFTSCEEILFVDDISEQEVSLYAPSDGAVLFSTGINLSWDKIANADKYHLQIAKPNFSAPVQVVLDTLISATSFTHQLNTGQYEWRIKAVNSGYETNYTTRAFEILNNEDFQDNTVILLTPTNNLITKKSVQQLSWQNIIGATEYQLQIIDGNDAIIKEETTSSTTIDFTFPDGSYNWKVRASNGSKATLYSARTVLVDTKLPNTPTLSSPANASSTAATDINFQFNRNPIAGSTEKDSLYVFTDNALTILKFKDQAVSPHSTTLTSGTYHWYVKSFDQAGNESTKSTVFSFIIN